MIKPGNAYDVIVIGVGSMGSSTCYHLAKRGMKVLGLDQFEVTHEHGSHGGETRIIRKAYSEHPDYVPLLEWAYTNWNVFEQDTGQQFYRQTGVAYFGSPDSEQLEGVRRSAEAHNVPIEEYTSAEAIRKAFPAFRLPEHYQAILEPKAGFLFPETAISAYVKEAQKLGAIVQTREPVLSWEQKGREVVVTTEKGTYTAEKLVITAGPWAGKLIPGMAAHLRTTRQVLTWMLPTSAKVMLGSFPCWMVEEDDHPGIFYGFPMLDDVGELGLKIAHHVPGQPVDPSDPPPVNDAEELEKLRTFLDRYLPGVAGTLHNVKHCLYTNTSDGHFVIDQLPGFEDHVTIACGFSGHGFKFASVMGEILADLALNGKTDHPIEFLSAKRFFG